MDSASHQDIQLDLEETLPKALEKFRICGINMIIKKYCGYSKMNWRNFIRVKDLNYLQMVQEMEH